MLRERDGSRRELARCDTGRFVLRGVASCADLVEQSGVLFQHRRQERIGEASDVGPDLESILSQDRVTADHKRVLGRIEREVILASLQQIPRPTHVDDRERELLLRHLRIACDLGDVRRVLLLPCDECRR